MHSLFDCIDWVYNETDTTQKVLLCVLTKYVNVAFHFEPKDWHTAICILPLCQIPVFQFSLGNTDHIHQHIHLHSIDHLQIYSAVYGMRSQSDDRNMLHTFIYLLYTGNIYVHD
jgi:hypothetical protein